jgi:hypothetical protein
MNREMNSILDGNESLRPASLTADTDGQGVDLRGSESATIFVTVGAIADDAADSTITLEESADDSTYTDVAVADIRGTEPTVAANTAYQFGYGGSSRYIRATFVIGGATSVLASAMIVRGNLDIAPTSAPRSNA